MIKRKTHRNNGFTIVELLIVITIIVILVGIGFAMATAVEGSSKIKLTTAVLRNAALIEAQYVQLTGGHFQTEIEAGSDWDITDHFMAVVGENPSLKKYIAQFPEYVLKENRDTLDKDRKSFRLFDAWGRRILYQGDTSVKDNFYNYLPKDKSYYFASSGPDGLFGVAGTTDHDSSDYQSLQDNLYSYDAE